MIEVIHLSCCPALLPWASPLAAHGLWQLNAEKMRRMVQPSSSPDDSQKPRREGPKSYPVTCDSSEWAGQGMPCVRLTGSFWGGCTDPGGCALCHSQQLHFSFPLSADFVPLSWAWQVECSQVAISVDWLPQFLPVYFYTKQKWIGNKHKVFLTCHALSCLFSCLWHVHLPQARTLCVHFAVLEESGN